MFSKYLYILVVIILFHFHAYSQAYNSSWIFGDSVGISFTSGSPVVLQQPVLSSHEACASISDSSGNLLFYVGSPTNFVTNQYFIHKVWDKNHQMMPNGDSLLGCSSFTQGALIIPFITNPDLYYVFHNGQISGVGRYLYYSVVDISANSGNGDVVLKNVQLQLFNSNSVVEKLSAVRHGNGRDWWVISHDFNTTYCLLLVTPNGISLPIYQDIGSNLSLGSAGQIQFSPDGSKLAVIGDNIIDLFDFDRCSGIISNWNYLGDSLIPTTGYGYYGCSFSPSSQILYVSNTDSLFQFDLTASNILNSRILLYDDTCHLTCFLGQHQVAPDGKIYIANASGFGFGNYVYDLFNMSISYLENPNVIGLGCNFNYLGQYLNGKRSFFGLPNNVNFSLGRLTGSTCDTLTSIESILEGVNVTHLFNYDGEIHLSNPDNINLRLEIYNSIGSQVINVSIRNSTVIKHKLSIGTYFYKLYTHDKLIGVQGKFLVTTSASRN